MANKGQINTVQYNVVYCRPQRLRTKNHDYWLGPTLEVRHSRTFRQIWQIWLTETMKQKLCTCSENRVQAEVAISWCWPKESKKKGSFWAAERTLGGRLTRLLATVFFSQVLTEWGVEWKILSWIEVRTYGPRVQQDFLYFE